MNDNRLVMRAWRRGVHIAVATLATFLVNLSDAIADDICTSFELQPTGICMTEAVFGIVPQGNFIIGTSPITATFTGGNVMMLGINHSGTHSWHVGPGVTATILFETPASEIELFFRDAQGGGPSHVRVINVNEDAFMSGNGTQFFQQVGVNNTIVGIDRIEVVNESSVVDVVVDDVFFVPESSVQMLQLTGLASLAVLARWRSRLGGRPAR